MSLSNQPKGLCIKVSSWSVREDAIGSIEIQTVAFRCGLFFSPSAKHKRLSNPHENQDRKNLQQQGNGAGVSCAFFLFLEQIAVRTCSRQRQYERIARDLINQQPVRLNVTFAKRNPISNECVIVVSFVKLIPCCQIVYDFLQKVYV